MTKSVATIILSADLGQRNVFLFLCNPLNTRASPTLIIGTLIQNEIQLVHFFMVIRTLVEPSFYKNHKVISLT
jgi:hypothetical protein